MSLLKLKIKWSRYIPHSPENHPKQAAFLMLPHREVLFGGAAGGGKSDALLMAALQYFDRPGYRGIIFRLSMRDAELSESIQHRCREWLSPFIQSKEVRYVGKTNTFHSIEGAELTFGYLSNLGDELGYQGGAWHFIGFEEATQFNPFHYTYMFSRNRRKKGEKHTYPLRIRATCNPGGPAHAVIRERFAIDKDEDGEFRGHNPQRPFIQSKMRDNPHLEHDSYDVSLRELDPVTRQRLRDGDWDASPDSVFKDIWFKQRWHKKGNYYFLSDPEKNYHRQWHRSQLVYFTSVDSAASTKTGIEGRVLTTSQQEPCWSACGTFAITPDHHLLWLDNWRGQVTIPFFIHKIVEITRHWKTSLSIQESNAINLGVVQGCQSRGLTVLPVQSIQDKVTRSIDAQLRAERGKIWLPEDGNPNHPWLKDLKNELFIWTGTKAEVSDQIDVLSLAGYYAAQKAHGSEFESGMASGTTGGHPTGREGLGASEGLSIASSSRTSPFMGREIGFGGSSGLFSPSFAGSYR